MRVTFRDYNGKGRMIGDALATAGHEVVDHPAGRVALLDADVPFSPYKDLCDNHDRVLLYPHGGGHCAPDGQWPVHDHTVVRFVPALGQAEVAYACHYPRPVQPIGWSFCELRPFTAMTPTTVLLAPQHQMRDGWMPPGQREANARIHDLLAALPVRLVVRFVKLGRYGIDHLGITPQPHVDYREAGLDLAGAIEAIDDVDAVVAGEGTFPSLAIARGKPTVMYGQIAPTDHKNYGEDRPAKRWDQYRDIVRYPLDADETDDIGGLLERACASDAEIAGWRSWFIGEPFDPDRFVTIFEKWAR